MFRKVLKKFGIISKKPTTNEAIEDALRSIFGSKNETSGANELREQLEFVEELKKTPMKKPVENFERKIGEQFEYEGTTLEVVATKNHSVGCYSCFFDNTAKACGTSKSSRGNCTIANRKDHMDVHFIKVIAEEFVQPQEGTKLDQGKISYSLLPFKAITEVVKVLEFGRLKYAKDNWQKVPNGKERYIDACLRHCISYVEGETTDPESGLHHLAHATCCLLFVIWFDIVGIEDEK